MNHTCLCLSQPKLVLIYQPRRDGRLSWPGVWAHTWRPLNIVTASYCDCDDLFLVIITFNVLPPEMLPSAGTQLSKRQRWHSNAPLRSALLWPLYIDLTVLCCIAAILLSWLCCTCLTSAPSTMTCVAICLILYGVLAVTIDFMPP